MLQDQARLRRRLNKLKRNKHGTPSTAEVERLQQQAQESITLRDRRSRNVPRVSYPEELPISARKNEILQAIKKHDVVIIAGETGSGKTTQIPKICLEAGRGRSAKIAVTQPRRVAALSLSRRLAEELGVEWGREVGCKIRFRDRTAPNTYIKMVTDGMLLAEIQHDPQLLEYDTIIVDEAHERSLNIDFLLGALRLLRRQRRDLKIIITSATIDTASFSQAFDGAPIIEVSGRMFPVEARFRPLEDLLGDDEDFNYIEGTVRAVEEALEESRQGDVLAFMPSERDIHECRDALTDRIRSKAEVLPLFGRLTAAEQQRVFSKGSRRRVVLATNIAETSLTIPGIRYVIDAGMARISRFNPRTQTQRLPIEPIAQSSAMQRRGRCGRVQDGVCVHLYSEADFLSRPEHTQPEIQRANLAEVILRMLALRLGQVETFPFIDPPQPQAINGAYQLLQELGALDENRRLTQLGRDMARLPLAPTVSRMLLQAHKEGALAEVAVIAAAISIQDPRERPLEQQAEADQMHRQFVHGQSDFLTLLNIWNAYHDQFEELKTQGHMRRFCRAHFLSFVRMREWRDIHTQIIQSLNELGNFTWNDERASYEAVHRAVLSGLLSNIAHKKEHNFYQAARAREVMIFPGSGLFQKKAPKTKTKVNGTAEDKSSTPPWLVAAEIVETSRLFARNVAQIEAAWLLEVGAHMCRSTYRDPQWSPTAGRVLVRETMRLYGLEIITRQIGYQRVDSTAATEIFIREALIADQIESPHSFIVKNRQLRHKIETWQTRQHHQGVDLDAAVYAFYSERIKDVSSVHDLNRLIRDRRRDDPDFLLIQEADLLGSDGDTYDRLAFPDTLELDGETIPLSYTYRPGQEDDGLTVRVPYKLINAINPEVLEWLVPGLLEGKVTYLLRALPKSIRKRLLPIPEKARQIAAELTPTHSSFLESLQAFIRARYGIPIETEEWDAGQIPEHLRMRIEVQGTEGQAVVAGRDLSQLSGRLEQHDTPVELEAWNKAMQEWARDGMTEWVCGDLPERVEVASMSGVPLFGFPGLTVDQEAVGVRLYKTKDTAQVGSGAGLRQLFQLVFKDELTWLKKELKDLSYYKDLYRFRGTISELQADALDHLQDYLFEREHLYPLDQASFEKGCEQVRTRIKGLSSRFLDLIENIIETAHAIRLCPHPYKDIQADLDRLLPAGFLRQISFIQLRHLERYLKALLVRAERARTDPRKDTQKGGQVKPYQEALEKLQGTEGLPDFHQRVAALRWNIEELRVSIFAQELGTAHPISPKRLDKQLEQLRAAKH